MGQSVCRSEDPYLLCGGRNFIDDLDFARLVCAYVLRSSHTHAKILSIDVAPALDDKQVLDVILWSDLERLGIGTLPCANLAKNCDGSDMIKPRRTSLVNDTLRYVGEPIALVVAETLAAARDAAERIVVEIEPLPSVSDIRNAQAAAAPQLHGEAPANLALDWGHGDEQAVA